MPEGATYQLRMDFDPSLYQLSVVERDGAGHGKITWSGQGEQMLDPDPSAHFGNFRGFRTSGSNDVGNPTPRHVRVSVR